MPIVFFDQRGLDLAGFGQQTPMRALDADRFVAGDGQHVGRPVLLQPGAPLHRATIDSIGHHPVERQARLSGPLKHLQSQLPCRMKLHAVGNASLAAARAISEPVFWQIQVTINQGVPAWGDVAECVE